MKTITSPDNALVKKALKLENPRNRDEHTRCLLDGCAHSRFDPCILLHFMMKLMARYRQLILDDKI